MNSADPDEDQLVDWADLPPEVRARIGPALPAGHGVWACLRKNGRKGAHTEWWWIDERGEMLEAFWFE